MVSATIISRGSSAFAPGSRRTNSPRAKIAIRGSARRGTRACRPDSRRFRNLRRMSPSDLQHGDAGTAERRAILDAIPTIAWCKLPDGSNEFVNQRWQDYTGISAEEPRGRGWQEAVHPDDLPKLSEKCAEIVASRPSVEFQGRLR